MGWWDDVLTWRESKRTLTDVLGKLNRQKKDKEESTKMAKKKIKFVLGDGKMPRKSGVEGGPFELRAPIPMTVPAGGRAVMKLGVKSPLPCLTIRRGVLSLVAPGTDLWVELDNSTGKEPLAIGDNEVVGHVFVVDNTDLVVE